MSQVQIWRTLAGVVALTPEAFGFSFCATGAEINTFRADLEAGVPMSKAVGFSGSHCGFGALVRVESKQGSPTVYVVAKGFLGKDREDFTFRRQADRDAFFEATQQLLGPSWHRHTTRGSWILKLTAIAGILLGLLFSFCGGLGLSMPTPEPKPGVTPMPTWGIFAILVFGLIVTTASVAGFLWARKSGGAAWEIISRG